jgi:hypothetical protein
VALEDSINESESHSVVIEDLNKAKGRESGVIDFSLQSTEETLANFIEMEKRRSGLESWVRSFVFPQYFGRYSHFGSISGPLKAQKTGRRKQH